MNKAKIKKCRNCRKHYSVPSPWPGCCTEDCFEKRKAKRIKKLTLNRVKSEIGSERLNFFMSSEFLQSFEWFEIRYKILKRYRGECMLCKAKDKVLNVDHILPRRTHPQLSLDMENLQVLCDQCNRGKGWKHRDDWRPKAEVLFDF